MYFLFENWVSLNVKKKPISIYGKTFLYDYLLFETWLSSPVKSTSAFMVIPFYMIIYEISMYLLLKPGNLYMRKENHIR